MTCRCGRTTLIPPIPCGTQIHCTHPCDRPPPACGHPKTPHTCHEQGSCPPCPFLTSKLCACRKTSLPNIRCSQEKVSCGTACGKLLACGSHTCDRLCHSGECGACAKVCGKDRKSWCVKPLPVVVITNLELFQFAQPPPPLHPALPRTIHLSGNDRLHSNREPQMSLWSHSAACALFQVGPAAQRAGEPFVPATAVHK
jgi:hypothetical protein